MFSNHEGETDAWQVGFRCSTAAGSRLVSLMACLDVVQNASPPAVFNIIHSTTTFLIKCWIWALLPWLYKQALLFNLVFENCEPKLNTHICLCSQKTRCASFWSERIESPRQHECCRWDSEAFRIYPLTFALIFISVIVAGNRCLLVGGELKRCSDRASAALPTSRCVGSTLFTLPGHWRLFEVSGHSISLMIAWPDSRWASGTKTDISPDNKSSCHNVTMIPTERWMCRNFYHSRCFRSSNLTQRPS